jgi:predicted ferric reductase
MSVLLGSKADWYLMRGTGAVSLLLLSLVVALGIASVNRFARGRLQRFVAVALHRNASLLAVVFLAVHVVTALADPYAGVSLAAVFVPYAASPYPLWLGLGALGLDLIVALILTSVLRRFLSPRLWRAVHWLAYAAWPVALVHGIGIGTDSTAGWMVAVDAFSIGLVVVAFAWRVRFRLGRHAPKYLDARRPPEIRLRGGRPALVERRAA